MIQISDEFKSSCLCPSVVLDLFVLFASQDAPVGNWDGTYNEQKLCHIPSVLYGQLLPASKVSPGTAKYFTLILK